MMNRMQLTRITTQLAIAAVIAACQAGPPLTPSGGQLAGGSQPGSPTGAGTSATPAGDSQSAGASRPIASTAIAPSICTSTRNAGPVSPTTGTLVGHIDQGRILIG